MKSYLFVRLSRIIMYFGLILSYLLMGLAEPKSSYFLYVWIIQFAFGLCKYLQFLSILTGPFVIFFLTSRLLFSELSKQQIFSISTLIKNLSTLFKWNDFMWPFSETTKSTYWNFNGVYFNIVNDPSSLACTR